jgi:hypothetical protein
MSNQKQPRTNAEAVLKSQKATFINALRKDTAWGRHP